MDFLFFRGKKVCSFEIMVFRSKISTEKRAFVRLACEQGCMSALAICKELKISKSSFYRFQNMNINESEERKTSKVGGRPRKLSGRDERSLPRHVKYLRHKEGNFTSKRLMEVANIDNKQVSNRTVRRVLNNQGYKFVQARKKGVLTTKDLKRRLSFARLVKRSYPKELWTDHINFYLDGVSFYFKTNPADQARTPRGRIWRKPNEGLDIGCTAKGHKEGSGGKVVKLLSY